MIKSKRIYPGLVSSLAGYEKDNEVAQIITPYAFNCVARWATEPFDIIVFHSLDDLVDNKQRLTDGQFNLIRDALKDQPWVCVVDKPLLKPIEGLVLEASPGFNHKGEQIVPMRYIHEARREQGGCPH